MVAVEQFADSEASKVRVRHSAFFVFGLNDAQLSNGGVRLPPNAVNVLYKWGLKDALSAISIESRSLQLHKCAFSWSAFLACLSGFPQTKPVNYWGRMSGMKRYLKRLAGRTCSVT